MIYTLPGRMAEIAASSYVAPSADLVGAVRICEQASIWFNAVLRGDNERIHIGNRSNVQDCCVLHTDPGIPLTIEDEVTIGHGVMLHGCRIRTGSVVGMGSTILNNAVIGENSLVGANALITGNKEFPPRSLLLGSPAKVVRELSDDEVEDLKNDFLSYVHKIPRYRSLAPGYKHI